MKYWVPYFIGECLCVCGLVALIAWLLGMPHVPHIARVVVSGFAALGAMLCAWFAVDIWRDH